MNARSAADGITVDLGQMRGVVIDQIKQTATVQGEIQCVLPACPCSACLAGMTELLLASVLGNNLVL